MILRDGKAVQSFQAAIFNNLQHGPFVWNQKYQNIRPTTAFSNHPYAIEERNESSPPNDEFSCVYTEVNHKQKQQLLDNVPSQKMPAAPFKSQSEIQHPDDSNRFFWDGSPTITQSSDEVSRGHNSNKKRNIPLTRGGVKRCSPVTEISSLAPTCSNCKRTTQQLQDFVFVLIGIIPAFIAYSILKMRQVGNSTAQICQQLASFMFRFWLIAKQTIYFVLLKFKFTSSQTKNQDLRRESVYGFRTTYKVVNIIIMLFPIALVVIVMTCSHHMDSTLRMQANDITNLNLPHTVQMQIPALTKGNIKFWHVAPAPKSYRGRQGSVGGGNDDSTALESLNDGQPIIIHLRNDESSNIFHRVNVFKALSDAGFHVLVPVQPLQKLDFVNMWSSVKKGAGVTKENQMYIWSDMRTVGDTKEYVDILTKMALFPKGVVIERAMYDQVDSVRNLEIWRGGMHATTYERNDFFWNYLKCPLTSPTVTTSHFKFLRDEVSLCVSAISFSPDFRARY